MPELLRQAAYLIFQRALCRELIWVKTENRHRRNCTAGNKECSSSANVILPMQLRTVSEWCVRN